MAERDLAIAVVGPAGLVGREILDLLEQRRFPAGSVRLLGSVRTAGRTIDDAAFAGPIELLGPEAFRGIDLAFFTAGPTVAGEFAPVATATGAAVIDLSSRHRLDPAIPLVVPEVNAAAIAAWQERGIVASPSAVVTGLAVALGPLAAELDLRRVVVATYQGVAGAGRAALGALGRESLALLSGRQRADAARGLAFDCVPSVGGIEPGGAAGFELRCTAEAQRVLARPDLRLHVTAVRVPVFFGVGLAVHVEAATAIELGRVRELLRPARGVLLHDEPGAESYRSLAQVGGSSATHVGRLRQLPGDPTTMELWVALDGIVKGAALNAVQIGEILARDHL